MRIVAGDWRGRTLIAPPGSATRPTADRVRQALFDMLMHADWGGRAVIEGAAVLDVFAGTGALGLEALSRGAASACFIENDTAALKALRANVAACKAGDRVEILAGDALSLPKGGGPARHGHAGPGHLSRHSAGIGGPDEPGHDDRAGHRTTNDDGKSVRWAATDARASLVFLDPPYGQNLVPRALARLRDVGRFGSDALIVAEIGRDEVWASQQPLLAERQYGAARILVFRVATDGSRGDEGVRAQ
jgi:16S rRNA (guanine966-N2)-methyltransferase